MRKRTIWTLAIIFAPLGAWLFVVVVGEIVKQLWNWLLPPIFGWHEITRWQGLGLLALCRILFGGRGGHSASPPSSRRTAEDWERCRQLPERLRQRLRDRFGSSPATGESKEP